MVVTVVIKKKVRPFHCSRNKSQRFKSALHGLFRVTGLFKPGTEDARERRWEMNGWHELMHNLIAKFRCPSRERRSGLVICRVEVKLWITLMILSIFSFGSKAWNLTESRLIPRNSREVVGPSVFLDATGVPKSKKLFERW